MAKERNPKLTYALVYRDDALLFVRKAGEEKFRLPRAALSPFFRKKKLKKSLYAAFGLEGKITRKLPELVDYDEQGKGSLLLAYVYEAALPEQIVGYEFAFYGEGDPALKDVDPASYRLAARALLYAPLYKGKPRTVPLLPEDDKKAYWEIRCIKHFHKKIPSAEIEEFESLVYSASSMRRVNAAFAALCNSYQVNPKAFIAELEYREKRRKVLQ